MRPLTRGRYRARLGESAGDVLAAQALRHLAFHGTDGLDQDAFDQRCQHLLVEMTKTNWWAVADCRCLGRKMICRPVTRRKVMI